MAQARMHSLEDVYTHTHAHKHKNGLGFERCYHRHTTHQSIIPHYETLRSFVQISATPVPASNHRTGTVRLL